MLILRDVQRRGRRICFLMERVEMLAGVRGETLGQEAHPGGSFMEEQEQVVKITHCRERGEESHGGESQGAALQMVVEGHD